MKKILLALIFLFLGTFMCQGQTCNCLITPIQPASCFSSCSASIVVDASLEELLIIVGLNKETAQKIVSFNKERKNSKVQSIEEYKKVLTGNDEFNKFAENIESLSQEQINYFQTPEKVREENRKNLEKLNKALDALNKTIKIEASLSQ